MTEHTPGPWVQSGDYGLLKTEIVAPNALHRAIASVWTKRVNERGTTLVSPEGEANARLIAAAPDLLMACEAFINWIDGDSGVMFQVMGPDGNDTVDWPEDTSADSLLHGMRDAIAKARGGRP